MNKQISTYFLTDARDYLSRYLLLRENATHIGLRSKLLIDLLFATECSLKSLIFLESENTEKETYKKVKKLGHKINSLIENLSNKSQEKCKEIKNFNLDDFEVHIRYSIESEIDFRGEKGDLDSKYYKTIANPQWLNNIYKLINQLIDYIEELDQEDKFKITNFSEIDLKKEISKHKKLTETRKK